MCNFFLFCSPGIIIMINESSLFIWIWKQKKAILWIAFFIWL